MSTTPNLLIAHIAASQNNKEVTANTAFDDFDEAICGHTSPAMADSDYTLLQATALTNMLFIFTGTLSADRHVILPANSKPYIVINETAGSPSAFNTIFKVGTGAVVATIPNDGQAHLIFSDGVNSVYKAS